MLGSRIFFGNLEFVAAQLVGAVSGVATVSGSLTAVRVLAGAASGAATLGTPNLKATRSVGLSGSIAGEATALGTPYRLILPLLMEGTLGTVSFVRGRIWIYRAIDYLDVDVSSCRLGSASLTEGTLTAAGATTRVTLIGT